MALGNSLKSELLCLSNRCLDWSDRADSILMVSCILSVACVCEFDGCEWTSIRKSAKLDSVGVKHGAVLESGLGPVFG